MRLHQDAVDVVDVDGSVLRADGFDQASHGVVSGLAEDAVGGTDDEVEGVGRKGVMTKSGAVELTQQEVAHQIGPEAFGDDRIGDAAFDVLVDAQIHRGEQGGSADEDEVVVLGKILEQQA